MAINLGDKAPKIKKPIERERCSYTPVTLGGKNISAHAQSVGITDHCVQSEMDLILAQVSMFTALKMTFVP